VLHSMTPYYAANPGIRTQTLATLFPFLEGMLPFLMRNDSGSPFFGAVTKADTHTKPPRNRPNRRANRSPKPAYVRSHAPVYPTTTRWSPHGPVAMSAASSSSSEPDPISSRLKHGENRANSSRIKTSSSRGRNHGTTRMSKIARPKSLNRGVKITYAPHATKSSHLTTVVIRKTNAL
jgi:hypothetical protein